MLLQKDTFTFSHFVWAPRFALLFPESRLTKQLSWRKQFICEHRKEAAAWELVGIDGPLARSGLMISSSRQAEVFWHSRETEGATRQGVNMEEGLGRERKRRRANAAFNHNCEKTDDGRRGSGPPPASGLLGMTSYSFYQVGLKPI